MLGLITHGQTHLRNDFFFLFLTCIVKANVLVLMCLLLSQNPEPLTSEIMAFILFQRCLFLKLLFFKLLFICSYLVHSGLPACMPAA